MKTKQNWELSILKHLDISSDYECIVQLARDLASYELDDLISWYKLYNPTELSEYFRDYTEDYAEYGINLLDMLNHAQSDIILELFQNELERLNIEY